eukprot:6188086-Pleurochrysis_carterae.AAC.1
MNEDSPKTALFTGGESSMALRAYENILLPAYSTRPTCIATPRSTQPFSAARWQHEALAWAPSTSAPSMAFSQSVKAKA